MAALWPALFRHLTYVHTSLHFTLTDRQECTARIIMCSYKYELNINNNRDLYCSNCSMWSKIISLISLSLLSIYLYGDVNTWHSINQIKVEALKEIFHTELYLVHYSVTQFYNNKFNILIGTDRLY